MSLRTSTSHFFFANGLKVSEQEEEPHKGQCTNLSFFSGKVGDTGHKLNKGAQTLICWLGYAAGLPRLQNGCWCSSLEEEDFPQVRNVALQWGYSVLRQPLSHKAQHRAQVLVEFSPTGATPILPSSFPLTCFLPALSGDELAHGLWLMLVKKAMVDGPSFMTTNFLV